MMSARNPVGDYQEAAVHTLGTPMVFLLMSVLARAPAQPMSGVYPVGPGGPGVDSFPTVQAAAAALSVRGLSGDVEFPVAPGFYSGAVELRNVAGSGLYRTRFRGETTGVMVSAGGAACAFEVESTDNVTIEAIRFGGARGTGSACVRFADSDSCRARSCRVGDSAEAGFLAERSDWLRLDSTRVEGPLAGSGSRGVDIRDCRNTRVERCSMVGSVGSGLTVTGGSGFFCRRVSVMQPLVHGLRIEDAPGGRYERCFTRGTPDYGVHAVRSAGLDFDSCTASGATVAGAYFEECDTLFYKIPMIVGSPERAFWLRKSEACTVRLLSLMGQPQMGLVYDRSPGCVAESTQMMGMDSDTGFAMLVDSCPDASFTFFQAVGNHRAGIKVRESDRVRIRHARVRGTVRQAGVVIENSSGVRIDPCSLNMGAGPAGVLLAGACRDDTLSGMVVLATVEAGIAAADTGVLGLVVANNFIAGWTGDGVRIERTRSPRFFYNTIFSPAERGVAGVRLRDVADAESKNNIVWNRGGDSSACYRIDGMFPFATGATNHNDLYASGSGGATALVNDTLYCGLADWRGHSSSPDPASIARDPLFADSGDFHLGPESPCRDSATPVAGILVDIDGDDRNPVSPDIGADEWRSGAVNSQRGTPTALPVSVAGSPTAGPVRVRYSLGCAGTVRLRLFDITGRPVDHLGRRAMAPGAHTAVVDLADLPPGVYMLELQAGPHIATTKLVRR